MYEAYFGLTSQPFRLAPDTPFYVDTPPHRAALTALQDGLADGAEFVPFIGEFGTGKTLVGRRLLEEIDRTRQVGAELSALRTEGDELFDRVVEAFRLPRLRGVRPLENAIRQFEGIVRDGCSAVLLVDDAHRLDAAVVRRLRKLTAIRVDGRTALRVCVAGRSTPGFEELRRSGHKLSVGAPIRLDLLDAGETRAYIVDRLRRAGWHGRPDFGTATAAIHERCQGNPARINRLCGHILLHLYMQGRDDVNAGVVYAVDDLLQAELRGEFATLALPPRAQAIPLATARASPAQLPQAALHGDALMARLIAQTLTPPATSLHEAAAPAPPAVPGISRRRRGLAQGAAALALLVAGGFLWQMICNFTLARAQATRDAAPSVAHVNERAPTPASGAAIAARPAGPAARED